MSVTKRLIEKDSKNYFYPTLYMGTMDSNDGEAVVSPSQIRDWTTDHFLSTDNRDSIQTLNSQIQFTKPLVFSLGSNQATLRGTNSYFELESNKPIYINLQTGNLKIEPLSSGVKLSTKAFETKSIDFMDQDAFVSMSFQKNTSASGGVGTLYLEDNFNLQVYAHDIDISTEGENGIKFNSGDGDAGYIFGLGDSSTASYAQLSYYQTGNTSSAIEISNLFTLKTTSGDIQIIPNSNTYIKNFKYSTDGVSGTSVGSVATTSFKPIYFNSGVPSTGWTFNLSTPTT